MPVTIKRKGEATSPPPQTEKPLVAPSSPSPGPVVVPPSQFVDDLKKSVNGEIPVPAYAGTTVYATESALPCPHKKERLDAQNTQYRLYTCLACGHKRYDPPQMAKQLTLDGVMVVEGDTVLLKDVHPKHDGVTTVGVAQSIAGPLPWEHDKPEQTIIDAIMEFHEGKKKGKLFLRKKEDGSTYEVKGWDADQRRVLLHGHQGKHRMVLKPQVTAREVAIYDFYWR